MPDNSDLNRLPDVFIESLESSDAWWYLDSDGHIVYFDSHPDFEELF